MKAKNLFLAVMVTLFGVVVESSGQVGTYPANQTSYLGVNPINSIRSVHIGLEAAQYSAPTPAQVSVSQEGMNCFIGVKSGKSITSGNNNVFLGYQSGVSTTTGGYNSFLGRSAGANNVEGGYNTFVGFASGYGNGNGTRNTYLGHNTGYKNLNGVGNVFIGNGAGYSLIGPIDNKLIISNDQSLTPLLYGDFVAKYIDLNGNVGVNLASNAVPGNSLEIRKGTNVNSGMSGLRFTNLTSASNVVANLSNPPKVLSVDANGDVILVNDTVGTGTGSSTIITQGTNINVSLYSPTTGYTISSPYQTLSQSGNTVTLSNGGSFTLPTFTDTDTDDQTLSIIDNVLSISEGNNVTLPITSVTAGTNVTVEGTGTSTDPFVISSTATGTGNNCNIYTCDGTLTSNRLVNMANNNMIFNTGGHTPSTGGRIYIGDTNQFSTGIGGNFVTLEDTNPANQRDYRLYVEGGILTERVKVALRDTNNWADYVFASDYKLMLLKDVEAYISENKHLPGIESAEQLLKKGLDLGEMQAKQMAKIEELTLYAIEQNKQLERQNKEIQELKILVKTLLEKK